MQKASKQYFLFRSIQTDRGTVSLKEKPFLHIEIAFGKTRLMLPVEILVNAGRLIDDLTPVERKFVRKILGGIIANSSG